MTVVEIPVVLTLPQDPDREPGVHVSGIIRCIATEVGILKPEWAEELSLYDIREITDPVAVLRISMGIAWERYYVPLIDDAIDHPGQYQVDGVYMSPDAESVSVIITQGSARYRLLIHEVKATYKSTRTVCNPSLEDSAEALASQVMWMMQMKAYCKARNTRFAILHVLFICGDYSFPIKPKLRKWLIEFTQQEVDDNWTLLTDYRDQRLKKEAQ